jgi:hypothetical protein
MATKIRTIEELVEELGKQIDQLPPTSVLLAAQEYCMVSLDKERVEIPCEEVKVTIGDEVTKCWVYSLLPETTKYKLALECVADGLYNKGDVEAALHQLLEGKIG